MTWRVPFRLSQYKHFRPGPYVRLIDPEERAVVEFIRTHGRLPGRGALEQWGVNDMRAFEDQVVVGDMRKAVKRSEQANRQKSEYMSDDKLAALHDQWTKEDAERAQEQQRQRNRQQQRLKDEKARAAELKAERRWWRTWNEHERAKARRARWESEDKEWTLWQQRREAKRIRQWWVWQGRKQMLRKKGRAQRAQRYTRLAYLTWRPQRAQFVKRYLKLWRRHQREMLTRQWRINFIKRRPERLREVKRLLWDR